MNMVIIAANFYRITIEVKAKPNQIMMELLLNGRKYVRCPSFRAENNMEIVLNESLCHKPNGFNVDKLHHTGWNNRLQLQYVFRTIFVTKLRPFRALMLLKFM